MARLLHVEIEAHFMQKSVVANKQGHKCSAAINESDTGASVQFHEIRLVFTIWASLLKQLAHKSQLLFTVFLYILALYSQS